MAVRGWQLVLLVGLLHGQGVILRADGPTFSGQVFAPPPAQTVWQPPVSPSANQTAPQSERPLNADPQSAGFYRSASDRWPAAPVGYEMEPIARPQYPAPNPSWNDPAQPARFDRLPPVQSVMQPANNASAAPMLDGTWHDDGQYVIIEVNGQKLRLAKSALAQQQVAPPPPSKTDGSVRGRLMQRGKPLVDCHVVIVPMSNERGANPSDGRRQPLTTVTNDDGSYYFERVPAGAYKLTWLPNGTNQWIRRLSMKPDVEVHPGEALNLREIRAAQQTIN